MSLQNRIFIYLQVANGFFKKLLKIDSFSKEQILPKANFRFYFTFAHLLNPPHWVFRYFQFELLEFLEWKLPWQQNIFFTSKKKLKYLNKKNLLLFSTFPQTKNEVCWEDKFHILFILPCWCICYGRSGCFNAIIFCFFRWSSRMFYKPSQYTNWE